MSKQYTMQHNRRRFIKITGGATAGFALSSMTGLSLLPTCNQSGKKIKSFGLQLYGIRNLIGKIQKKF